MSDNYTLLPEWAPQEAVMLTWPDKNTDWHPWLRDVQNVYLTIIEALNQANTLVVLLVSKDEIEYCKSRLNESSKILLVTAQYNDTWI